MASFVKRQCAYCNGAGKIARHGVNGVWTKCVACDGFKFVFVPDTYTKCEDCDGTGQKASKLESMTPYRCRRCKGTGWSLPHAQDPLKLSHRAPKPELAIRRG